MSRNCTGRKVAGVVVALFGFGVVYDGLVGRWKRRGRATGYGSILVIGGTLVTLLVSVLLNGWEATIRTLACFAASGTPMAVGSMWRHCKRREGAERRVERFISALEGHYAQEVTSEGWRDQV